MVLAQRRLTLLSERDDPDFNKDLLQAKGTALCRVVTEN